MTHDSCGEWKRPNRSLEFETVATHYLFRKHFADNTVSYSRIEWMMCGIVLVLLIASAHRLSLRPLGSFQAEIRRVAGGYSDCPLLKSDHSLDRVQDTLSCR